MLVFSLFQPFDHATCVFHLLTSNLLDQVEFIQSSISLPYLPIWFFAGFISRVVIDEISM